MLAGVEGLLPVTPRLLPLFHLKVAQDLRGKWKKDIEAYRWFYAEYGSQLSRRVCAYLDPGVFELRDYFVEFKVPLMWVSAAPHRPRKKNSLRVTCFRNSLPISLVWVGWIMGKQVRRVSVRSPESP
jgi:hypothetical protein